MKKCSQATWRLGDACALPLCHGSLWALMFLPRKDRSRRKWSQGQRPELLGAVTGRH